MKARLTTSLQHSPDTQQPVAVRAAVLLVPFKSLKNFYVDFTHFATKYYAKHWDSSDIRVQKTAENY
jgi:hypothetical protein